MPHRVSKTGSELFIVDNSDEDWKVLRYLHEWCQLSKSLDVASGYFEIGSLLALKDEWQKVDSIRILMGDEVSKRTRTAFAEGLERVRSRLDASLEIEKQRNDFLVGVPAIVEAIRSGKIQWLTENIELNVQITGRPVNVLQEWYEEHWDKAEDVTPEILRTIERHTRDYSPFEVYAKSLHEFFRRHEMTDQEWLLAGPGKGGSRIYQILDQYQKDGYHELMDIARNYRGAPPGHPHAAETAKR